MERTILVGAVGAGKTTLFNALQGDYSLARKTQAIEFGNFGDVDTPGEYFSHPRLYHALINTLIDCDVLVYVHAANDRECRIPVGLLDVYHLTHKIPVITKTDLPDADVEGVKAMLETAGFSESCFALNCHDPKDVEGFKAFLSGLRGQKGDVIR
ncbi:MAG: EutP/PduV family microcompartment system protein [Telmatospirillum sp.]|nr:EutP/PduV family microcompartment system protein [Telmatospirillum sp.]